MSLVGKIASESPHLEVLQRRWGDQVQELIRKIVEVPPAHDNSDQETTYVLNFPTLYVHAGSSRTSAGRENYADLATLRRVFPGLHIDAESTADLVGDNLNMILKVQYKVGHDIGSILEQAFEADLKQRWGESNFYNKMRRMFRGDVPRDGSGAYRKVTLGFPTQYAGLSNPVYQARLDHRKVRMLGGSRFIVDRETTRFDDNGYLTMVLKVKKRK